MQRGHCRCGNRLYEEHQQKFLDLVTADAEKRRSVSASSRVEWREIARRAEEARMESERTRCAYIEHVMMCRSCEWDRLTDAYLNTLERYGFETSGTPYIAETA